MTGDTKEDAVTRARDRVLDVLCHNVTKELLDAHLIPSGVLELDEVQYAIGKHGAQALAASRAEGAREAEALVRRLVGALERLWDYAGTEAGRTPVAARWIDENVPALLADPLVTAIMERGEEE